MHRLTIFAILAVFTGLTIAKDEIESTADQESPMAEGQTPQLEERCIDLTNDTTPMNPDIDPILIIYSVQFLPTTPVGKLAQAIQGIVAKTELHQAVMGKRAFNPADLMSVAGEGMEALSAFVSIAEQLSGIAFSILGPLMGTFMG